MEPPRIDPMFELIQQQRETNNRLKTVSTCLVILTVLAVAFVVLDLLAAVIANA